MSESRIEVRDGRQFRVDVMRRDKDGNVISEFCEPLDDEPAQVQNTTIADLPTDPNTGLPIRRFTYEPITADGLEPLPCPAMPGCEPPRVEPDDKGLPVLPTPTIVNLVRKKPQTGKAKTIPNETDYDDKGLPVLPTPTIADLVRKQPTPRMP